jgi:hypothetical protein
MKTNKEGKRREGGIGKGLIEEQWQRKRERRDREGRQGIEGEERRTTTTTTTTRTRTRTRRKRQQGWRCIHVVNEACVLVIKKKVEGDEEREECHAVDCHFPPFMFSYSTCTVQYSTHSRHSCGSTQSKYGVSSHFLSVHCPFWIKRTLLPPNLFFFPFFFFFLLFLVLCATIPNPPFLLFSSSSSSSSSSVDLLPLHHHHRTPSILLSFLSSSSIFFFHKSIQLLQKEIESNLVPSPFAYIVLHLFNVQTIFTLLGLPSKHKLQFSFPFISPSFPTPPSLTHSSPSHHQVITKSSPTLFHPHFSVPTNKQNRQPSSLLIYQSIYSFRKGISIPPLFLLFLCLIQV